MQKHILRTPKGLICVSCTPLGLYSLNLPKEGRQEEYWGESDKVYEGHLSWFNSFIKTLEEYFKGEKVDFTLYPIDFTGISAFSVKVLNEAALIPWGRVSSYKALAEAAENPKALRAVGGVMKRNRLPVVIPCHRVIKSDGALGGFNSGLSLKRYLLSLEGLSINDTGYVFK